MKFLRAPLWALMLFSAVGPEASHAIPPPAIYHPILPLTFDGTSFRVPKTFTKCRKSWDATPYIAPTSGLLTFSGTVMLMQGCAPMPVSRTARLYIIAVHIPVNEPGHTHPLYPRDFGTSFPAVAIAGPTNADEEPWVFAPIPFALKMRAGEGYAFFVASVQTGAESLR